jgi:hypothetical protein
MIIDHQRVREIAEQIVAIFDADGDSNQRVGDPHLGAARLAHLPEDRVRHRNRERAVVAEIRRKHDDAKPIQELERIDPIDELERQQRAETAKQLARERMLRVRSEAWIVDGANITVRCEKIRQCLRVETLLRESERERLRADRDVMGIERSERSAEIAQAFLADLCESPQRGLRRLIRPPECSETPSSRTIPCR